jgi:hypothetical protein
VVLSRCPKFTSLAPHQQWDVNKEPGKTERQKESSLIMDTQECQVRPSCSCRISQSLQYAHVCRVLQQGKRTYCVPHIEPAWLVF